MLEVQNRDITAEIMWVAMGGVVGALPAASEAILRYIELPYIFSVTDLMQIIIFVASAAAFLVTGWLHRRHVRDKSTIFTKIRAQRKD